MVQDLYGRQLGVCIMQRYYCIVVLLSLLGGCSYGPFHLEKEEGEMPKAWIDMPFEGRFSIHNSEEVGIVWKRKFH